jgi:hypothetical protein
MRILFILEPAAVRNGPEFLTAHFAWVRLFERAALAAGGGAAHSPWPPMQRCAANGVKMPLRAACKL